jgi:hypothetical protein
LHIIILENESSFAIVFAALNIFAGKVVTLVEVKMKSSNCNIPDDSSIVNITLKNALENANLKASLDLGIKMQLPLSHFMLPYLP